MVDFIYDFNQCLVKLFLGMVFAITRALFVIEICSGEAITKNVSKEEKIFILNGYRFTDD